MNGKIIAGALAPHPPHLIYAANPKQNEPRSEGGWETLRWGYEKLAQNLAALDYDVLMVLSPHWRTYVGTHVLAYPHFQGLSVDPIFPHLFRYHYDLKVDTELAHALKKESDLAGFPMKQMTNPDFRVDYGTIISCHLANPKWDKPIVALSSHAGSSYYSPDVMQNEMLALAEVTKKAIAKSGKRVVLLASNSLSHRHFTNEPDVPEDMSHEHIYNHSQYLWDMKMIEMIKAGQSKQIFDLIPDFTEQAISETDSGALSWLLATMDFPKKPGVVHAYGSVIGTGNAVALWTI